MLNLELTNKLNWTNYFLFESLYWLIACTPLLAWIVIVEIDSPHLKLISTVLIYCISIIILLTLVLYKVKCNLYGRMNFIERHFNVCLTSTQEHSIEQSEEHDINNLQDRTDAETLEAELEAINN